MKSKNKNNKMRLFVLAAGKGTRLWPLTKTTPKILLDTGSGLTLLDKQIENAIESKEIDEVVLIEPRKHAREIYAAQTKESRKISTGFVDYVF